MALYLLSGAAAARQGFGARAYILVPDATRIGSVWALNTTGNGTPEPGRVFQGQDVDVSLAILQYTQTVDLGGQQARQFAVVPMGCLDVDFNFSFCTRTGTASGPGRHRAGCRVRHLRVACAVAAGLCGP